MGTEIRLKLKLRYATVQLPANLSDLDDVLLTAVQNGQILMYDDTSETWYNVTPTAYGDMLKAVYDPNTVEGDAFDMDNMVESATRKVLTNTERNLIASAEQAANKGASEGYAPLDLASVVPLINLPDSVKTGSEYKGAWNVNTNTPTIADGSGSNGDYYRCSVAGTVDVGSGPISFEVGNTIVYNGTTLIWEKIGVADNDDAFMPKLLNVNDQRGLGAYVLADSDFTQAKMVLVDDAVTVPAGLTALGQCTVINANAAKQTLTINAAYTTVIGAPEANITGDKLVVLGVVDSSTLIVEGATEA